MRKRNIYLVLGMALSVFSCTSQNSQTAMAPIDPINAPFDMPQLTRPEFPGRIFSISDYGAVADSVTLNTDAFARAIGACSKAGGGRVIVTAGIWLTGPVELKSNVNLHLEENTEIRFTTEKKYYYPEPADRPKGFTPEYYRDYENPELTPIPMISAYDCSNIAITGKGTLNGQGLSWWPLQGIWWRNNKGELGQEVYEKAREGLEPGRRYIRAIMIEPTRCRNVLIEGVTVLNGPRWMVHPVMCENVTIRHLTVTASSGKTEDPDTPNTDGINPESCKNVLIEHCEIYTGDNSIAIKSGRNEAGRIRGTPSENIVIRHCKAKSIAIGSEMSGGVRNILIDDCDFSETPPGFMAGNMIHVKTQRGRGGTVENVWIQNIKTGPANRHIIKIDMEYYDRERIPGPVTAGTPKIRNLHFKNIESVNDTMENAIAIFLNGLPEMPIDNVTFEQISIPAKKGIVCRNVHGVVFRDVQVKPLEGPVVSVENCWNVAFAGLDFPKQIKPFLSVAGEKSENIRLDKALLEFQEDIIFENGAGKAAIVENKFR